MKKITYLIMFLSFFGFSQNLVINGDFQTGTAAPWYNNAANVVDLGGGNFVNQANVMAAGNSYDVNLSQDLSLDNGKTYEMTFDAFTDAVTSTRTLVIGLGQNNAPWAALTQTVNLTDVPQTFTFQFTINYGDAVGDRVIFDMGAAVGFVFIDNVSVVEVVNTCSNGIQDGDETGVDCGGSCTACTTPPTSPAPTPPSRPTADVVSIFSNAYTNIPVNQWGPDWGPSSARINDAPISGNDTKLMDVNAGQVFAGIDFAPNQFDATTFTHFHLDYYITAPLATGQVLSIKLSNHLGGAGETSAIEITPAAQAGQWVQLDILLDDFLPASAPANLDRSAIAQIVITAARADGNVPVDIYLDNIYFHKNTVLSSESFNLNKIKLYPNPASNVLNIEALSTIETVEIYNLLGQKILTKNSNTTIESIDISSFESGIYIVKVSSEGKFSTSKFTKR